MGGAEKHIIKKATYLKERGHNCFVMSCGGELESELENLQIPHFPMFGDIINPNSISLQNIMEDLINLGDIVSKYKINVISCMPTMPFYYAYIIHKLLKVNFVYEILAADYFITDFPNAVLETAEFGGIVASNSFVTGKNQADAVGFDVDKIKIIPMFAETKRFYPNPNNSLRKQLGINDTTIVLMTMCRLEGYKTNSIYELIQFMPEWSKKHDLALVVVGDGSERVRLENLARNCGVENIYFLGTRNDPEAILQNCDIFVGMGTVVFDAAACKKPVIIDYYQSKSFDDSSTGYFGEDPYDSHGGEYPGMVLKSVHKLVYNLIENEKLRMHWADVAYSTVISRFSYENVLKQWEDYLIEISSKKRA